MSETPVLALRGLGYTQPALGRLLVHFLNSADAAGVELLRADCEELDVAPTDSGEFRCDHRHHVVDGCRVVLPTAFYSVQRGAGPH